MPAFDGAAGDALTIRNKPVNALPLPVHAAWPRTSYLTDWDLILPPTAPSVFHDSALNRVGVAIMDGLLGNRDPGIGSIYAPPPYGSIDNI